MPDGGGAQKGPRGGGPGLFHGAKLVRSVSVATANTSEGVGRCPDHLPRLRRFYAGQTARRRQSVLSPPGEIKAALVPVWGRNVSLR